MQLYFEVNKLPILQFIANMNHNDSNGNNGIINNKILIRSEKSRVKNILFYEHNIFSKYLNTKIFSPILLNLFKQMY